MSEILKDLSAAALTNAIEANHFERFRLFRYWSQAEVHDDPELLWIITSIPFPLFNNILHARLSPENADVVIEEVKGYYASRNVPVQWWIGPTTQPANLGDHLKIVGFVKEDKTPGMAVDLHAMNEESHAPVDLVIEQVTNLDNLRRWYQVLKAVYGLPDYVDDAWIDSFACIGFGANRPLYCYLGWLGGKPVATSYLILGAGVAGMYGVGTIPEVRKQGIGTELTLAALREARELGYRIGILRTSEIGYGVYSKIGFRKYCNMDIYLWEAAKTTQQG